MATVKAANVTKYDAGGSGDNVIADGYIKTVEKVWIDTYSVAAAIPSTSAIAIGKVPAGKKLTDIIVYLPVLGASGSSTSTVNCGTAVVHNSGTTGNLGFLVVDGTGKTLHSQATISTLRLGATGALTEMSEDSDIYIFLNPATTITAGTIRTIIKYT